MKVRCLDCGNLAPASVKFCPHCGGHDFIRLTDEPQQTETARFCDNCGCQVNDQDEICSNCGYDFGYSESSDDAFEYNNSFESEYTNDLNQNSKEKSKKHSGLFILLICLIAILGITFAAVVLKNNILGGDFPVNDESTTTTFTTMPTVTTSTTSAPLSHILPAEVYISSYPKFTASNGYFNCVKASSYADWSGTRGLPEWAFDGKPTTSWQDGIKSDYGVGEWLLSYNADGKTENISRITVYNGYQNTSHNTSSKDLYILNSRVSDFSLEFDDGKILKFTLSDTKRPQTFDFGETIETCFVKFKIESVYEGTGYSDTCISEIVYQ